MILRGDLRVSLEAADNSEAITDAAARAFNVPRAEVRHVSITRRSLDCRRGKVSVVLRIVAYVGEDPIPPVPFARKLQNVTSAQPVVVVGSGPAGLFAALRLIELGMKPIVLERGKEVRKRRRDIAELAKHGIVNPESNYCFGEGGAGTFSDGKLYTRSQKRGSIESILQTLVLFGADASICIESHPHIGTNRLPQVIEAMRNAIRECGGEVHFECAFTEMKIISGKVSSVITSQGEISTRGCILATGHSARDVMLLLQRHGIAIEYKPFALGVRIEHPQTTIDQSQYHCSVRPQALPAASYSLRTQVEGRGVYSFCMCPGGIICPASTSQDLVVVNGWSPSKRNSRFANSGIVVEVREEDLRPFASSGALRGMLFQEQVEKQVSVAGGGNQKAPAQRVEDFCNRTSSRSLPECSYLPGTTPQNLWEVLPQSYCQALHQAFQEFSKRIPNYASGDAIMVAVESRTSSPVRIPRDALTRTHPDIVGLFPCGEGAGYAGGIVSAAIDGERVAEAVQRFLCSN